MNTIFAKRARQLAEESNRTINKKRRINNDDLFSHSHNLAVQCANDKSLLGEIYTELGMKYHDISLDNIRDSLIPNINPKKLFGHRKYKWLMTTFDGITYDGKLIKINCLNNISNEIPEIEWIKIQIDLEIANLNECQYIENKFIEVKNRREQSSYPNAISHGSKFINGKCFRWVLAESKTWVITRDYQWFKKNLSQLIEIKNGIPCKIIPEESDYNDDLTLENVLNSENPNNEFKLDYSYWVSATKTRNYLIDDTLCDYLKLYHRRNSNIYSDGSYSNDICQKGQDFENALVDYLYQQFPGEIITIVPNRNLPTLNHFKETYNEMIKGTPIICQAALFDFDNKTFGIADLIIRSDYIGKMFDNYKIPDKDIELLDELNGNPYYVAADIKLHKLYMTADAEHLRNTGSMKAYKGQVLVYNRALARLQNYDPKIALILGRRWTSKRSINKITYVQGNNNCLDRPGVVDFVDRDEHFNDSVDDAVDWIRRVRTEGSQWKLLPKPSIPELYPNMCVRHTYGYDKFKSYLAKQLDEITNVYYCSAHHRRIAHKKGIYKWTDPNCTAENMEITGAVIPFRINKILDANREDKLVTPDILHIIDNDIDWTDNQGFYVDFESVSDVFSDFNNMPYTTCKNLTFLIGCGWINPDTNKWEYKYFCAKKLTLAEEARIFTEWHNFMLNMSPNGKLPLIYHYDNYEQTEFKKIKNKHSFSWDIDTWFDFYKKVIKPYPVCVKGSLKLSLKSIGKALYCHGLINTTWPKTSICTSGLDATVIAKKCGDIAIKRNVNMEDLPEIQDIIKYNHADCRVMFDIINYLRENHINRN